MTPEQSKQARREKVEREMAEKRKTNAIIRFIYRREPFVKAGSR